MADVNGDDVKTKFPDKNSILMERHNSDSLAHESHDSVANTLQPPNHAAPMPPQVRKKTSSFQITSVTQSRLSHDGGEDSADDLDESHTEDLSSELIDCSKTTDIDNDGASSEDASASAGVVNIDDGIVLAAANVTSDNVTIGVPVPLLINAALSIATTANTSVNTVPVTVSSNVSPIVPVVTDLVVGASNQQQWENRFKVVKIVNTEPFNRGRWIVMDYTDPTLPPSVSSAPASDMKTDSNTEGAGSGNSSAGSSVHYVPGENQPSENPITSVESNQPSAPPPVYINPSQPNPSQQPQQSEYSVANVNQNTSNAQNIATSNLPVSTSQTVTVTPHPVVPVVTPSDPPTVIVQDKNLVPIPSEQQNSVPQKDDKDVSSIPADEQPTVPENLTSDTPVLRPLLDSLPDTLGVSPKVEEAAEGDEAESASGSSTVGIDNKIEQAMDLVKSHLMFAVREEVDVLKEKITELVDKISQLELENGILKASASQETLNKLSQQQQPPQQQQQQTNLNQNTQSSQSPPQQNQQQQQQTQPTT